MNDQAIVVVANILGAGCGALIGGTAVFGITKRERALARIAFVLVCVAMIENFFLK